MYKKPHRTYVTGKMLMCGECRKPIRKLRYEDYDRLNYITGIKQISEEESNELGTLLDLIKN